MEGVNINIWLGSNIMIKFICRHWFEVFLSAYQLFYYILTIYLKFLHQLKIRTLYEKN
jgi:hypothetical protein